MTFSLEKLKLWQISILGAVGPVYWLPGVSPANLAIFKTVLITLIAVTCCMSQLRRIKKIDLMILCMLLTIFCLGGVVNGDIANLSLLFSVAIFIFFYAASPIRDYEAIRFVVARAVPIFSIFPLLITYDFLLSSAFLNPFYEYSVFLYSSGFQGGRTGWAFWSNIFLALTLTAHSMSRDRISSFIFLLIALLIFSSIFLVGSRGGILTAFALLFAYITYILMYFKYNLVSFLILFTISIPFLFILLNILTSGDLDFERLRLIQMASNNNNEEFLFFDAARQDAISVINTLIEGGIFLGQGQIDLRNFGFEYERIHNVWLRILVESGIFMVALILIFSIFRVHRLVGFSKRYSNSFFLIIIPVLIGSLVEPTVVFGNFQASLFFWILISSAVALQENRSHIQ